jgi:hypothetical protein
LGIYESAMRHQLRYRRGRATVFGSQFEIFFVLKPTRDARLLPLACARALGRPITT